MSSCGTSRKSANQPFGSVTETSGARPGRSGTVTSTSLRVPGVRAGDVASTSVELGTTTPVADWPPIVSVREGRNPLPETTTEAPPAAGPDVGEIEKT